MAKAELQQAEKFFLADFGSASRRIKKIFGNIFQRDYAGINFWNRRKIFRGNIGDYFWRGVRFYAD